MQQAGGCVPFAPTDLHHFFDEPEGASAGVDLKRWVDKGLLKFHADRPNRHGLETHLLEMHHMV